jgi:hypothetical protein
LREQPGESNLCRACLVPLTNLGQECHEALIDGFGKRRVSPVTGNPALSGKGETWQMTTRAKINE